MKNTIQCDLQIFFDVYLIENSTKTINIKFYLINLVEFLKYDYSEFETATGFKQVGTGATKD